VRTFRTSPADVGRQRLRVVLARFARELRLARMAVGLTQQATAGRAGFTQEYVSAIERGVRAPSFEAACRLASACGHELAIRLFPEASVSLRDTGQLEVAETIMGQAAPGWHCRLEVPVGDGSRRAHDLVMTLLDEVVAVEVERRLVDLQAQLRAAQLKRDVLAQREDRPVRLVICVPDTPAMRRLIGEHQTLVRRVLPVRSRSIWRAPRVGQAIGGDGILFVRRRAGPPGP
jgi:transcriptional regulator with XRE-family HTH domain